MWQHVATSPAHSIWRDGARGTPATRWMIVAVIGGVEEGA
jgi:hypothetical protein